MSGSGGRGRAGLVPVTGGGGGGAAMRRGERFGSYRAFLQRFRAYKQAQGTCYGLRSCLRVRCYNLQRGTAIREDVR